MAIKTVYRPKWTPPSLRNEKKLVRKGSVKIGERTYVCLARWSKKRRAFVLEALVLYSSTLHHALELV